MSGFWGGTSGFGGNSGLWGGASGWLGGNAPVVVPSSYTVNENVATNTVVGALSVVNAPSGPAGWAFAITSQNPAGKLAISGVNLQTAAAIDYETTPSINLTITATKASQPNVVSTMNINVGNIAEQTLVALTGTFTLPESAAQGAIAGALAGMKAGSTLSLSNDGGGRVGLSGNNIVRGFTALDYETAPTVNFTVVETNPDGTNSPNPTNFTLTVTNVLEVVYGLLYGTFTLPEDAAAGAVAGAVFGMQPGSTLSIAAGGSAGGKIAVSGNNVVRGAIALDYETAPTFTFALKETNPDASGTMDSVLSFTVTNVLEVTLGILVLSGNTWPVGSPANGTIIGATAGSTLSVSGQPAGFTINSAARTWAYDGSGSPSTGMLTLTETHPDATNSGRATSLSWTLTAASSHLNLDFTTGSLPSGASVTGGANGTRRNTSGFIVAASAPRFDNGASGTLCGLLNEPAATNLCLQSARMDLSPWTAFTTTSLTPTGQFTTSPDGTNNACKLVIAPTTDGAWSQWYQLISVTPGLLYTGSMWIKGAAGGETIYLFAVDNDGTNFFALGYVLITCTTAWQRFSFPFVGPASGSVQFCVGYTSSKTPPPRNLTFPVGMSGGTYHVWNGTLEPGGVATSDIITTTAAVTRTTEDVSFTVPGADNTIVITNSDGTVQYLDAAAGVFHLPPNLDQFKIASITSQALASTPITSVTFGTRFKYSQVAGHYINSDVWANAWGPDNEVYAASDDMVQSNWDISSSTSAYNVMLHNLSSGTFFNTSMRGNIIKYGWADYLQFGAQSQSGSDGLNYKSTGLGFYNNILYNFINRHHFGDATSGWDKQAVSKCQLLKSTSMGMVSTPLPPSAAQPYTSPMFGPTDFPAPSFICYGKNNANNLGPHRSGQFAYATSTDGFYFNGNAIYLGRCLLSALPNLNAADWQYWKGGDWQVDANWGAWSARVPILSNANKLCVTNIQYIPARKRYVMFQWYFPSVTTSYAGVESSVVDIYEGADPTSMTKIQSTPFNAGANLPPGFYGPNVVAKGLNVDGGNHGYLLGSGNFVDTFGEYTLQLVPYTLNP